MPGPSQQTEVHSKGLVYRPTTDECAQYYRSFLVARCVEEVALWCADNREIGRMALVWVGRLCKEHGITKGAEETIFQLCSNDTKFTESEELTTPGGIAQQALRNTSPLYHPRPGNYGRVFWKKAVLQLRQSLVSWSQEEYEHARLSGVFDAAASKDARWYSSVTVNEYLSKKALLDEGLCLLVRSQAEVEACHSVGLTAEREKISELTASFKSVQEALKRKEQELVDHQCLQKAKQESHDKQLNNLRDSLKKQKELMKEMAKEHVLELSKARKDANEALDIYKTRVESLKMEISQSVTKCQLLEKQLEEREQEVSAVKKVSEDTSSLEALILDKTETMVKEQRNKASNLVERVESVSELLKIKMTKLNDIEETQTETLKAKFQEGDLTLQALKSEIYSKKKESSTIETLFVAAEKLEECILDLTQERADLMMKMKEDSKAIRKELQELRRNNGMLEKAYVNMKRKTVLSDSNMEGVPQQEETGPVPWAQKHELLEAELQKLQVKTNNLEKLVRVKEEIMRRTEALLVTQQKQFELVDQKLNEHSSKIVLMKCELKEVKSQRQLFVHRESSQSKLESLEQQQSWTKIQMHKKDKEIELIKAHLETQARMLEQAHVELELKNKSLEDLQQVFGQIESEYESFHCGSKRTKMSTA